MKTTLKAGDFDILEKENVKRMSPSHVTESADETITPVNELKITNAATGSGPILSSVSTSATDSNIDINITPLGTGNVNLSADADQIGDNDANATLTTQGTGDLILNTNNGTNAGDITLLDGANGNIEFTNNGTGVVKFNDAAYFPEGTLVFDASQDWDVQASPVAKVTLTADVVFDAPSNSTTGQFISILCIQDGTGGWTIGWNAVFEFTADTAPTATTTADQADLFNFRYNGAKWLNTGNTLDLAVAQEFMYALIENNEIKETFSNPKALTIGDVQYPKNIFTEWSKSELNNVGLYTVVFDDSSKKDDSCYTNTDVSYAFADGKVTASYGVATPKELLGLKSQKKEPIDERANYLLFLTDWYVVKATEVESYSVPEAVTTYRADVRTASNDMESKIDACSTVDELAALYVYTDGSRPLGEFPTLET